ncbi:hypothetical protein ACWD5F_45420 [Streptomyces sp. NPDC002499]
MHPGHRGVETSRELGDADRALAYPADLAPPVLPAPEPDSTLDTPRPSPPGGRSVRRPAARIHVAYDGPTTVTDPLVLGTRERYSIVVLAWISANTWPQPAPSGPAPNSPPTPMR